MTTRRTLLATVGTALCLGPTIAIALQPSKSVGPAADQMVAFQYAASHGDRSQVPAMIQQLSAPHALDYRLTLLYSLAMLGAAEALPAIDSLIKTEKDPVLVTCAKVERARLVAEDAARNVADPKARATIKVRRFYRELDLTPEDINAAAASYKADRAAHQNESDYAAPVTVALEALPELADMVYQSYDYRDYASLPEIRKVDFTADLGPALKMRLAPLSRPDRIKTMVEEIANSSPSGGGDYEIQLLADEGDPARLAAAAKMQEMDAQQAQAQANMTPSATADRDPGGDRPLGYLELGHLLDMSGGPVSAPATQSATVDAHADASTSAPGPASKKSRKYPHWELVIAY